MKSFQSILILCVLAILITGDAAFAFAQKLKDPRVFLLTIKGEDWQKKASDPAVAKADRDAKKALSIQIAPITSKSAVAPSGDKHDYMSQAPYFWRDPNKPNGLPYIRRDGERNPEIKQYPDHDLLDSMINAVDRLSLGYFVTGKKEYAARAGEILRMWFIEPKTRMNPNLEFAQAIPGLNTGRGIGIIETRGLVRVVDSVGLLADSPSWTKADQAGVEAWFSKYLEWLTGSKNGRQESAAKNNHGTHYDLQVASFALFVGDRDLARKTLEEAKKKRIAAQIETEGKQPLELERTKSWDYSVMNLEGMVSLAQLGEKVDVNLWTFHSDNGGSIRKAIEFLEPFSRDIKMWPYKQITPIQLERFYSVVRRAARGYGDAGFQKMLALFPKVAVDDRIMLDR